MLRPEDCEHAELAFGSGDYYIFCRACHACWVRTSRVKDEPRPDLAVGHTLSGQKRVKEGGDGPLS